jgi:predicted regulator of Ras-like GTPase activity (Roadblock/LC7/MglB family)
MAQEPQNRSQQIDRILTDLMALKGVTAAAIVDADGFVTHIRRDFEINSDALGAAVQIVFGAAQKAAQHVEQNSASLVISENQSGLVIFAPLAGGFILSIVADSSAMLGSIRFEARGMLPALSALLGQAAGSPAVRPVTNPKRA